MVQVKWRERNKQKKTNIDMVLAHWSFTGVQTHWHTLHYNGAIAESINKRKQQQLCARRDCEKLITKENIFSMSDSGS